MLSLLTALCALRLPDAPASAPRYGFPSGDGAVDSSEVIKEMISTLPRLLVEPATSLPTSSPSSLSSSSVLPGAASSSSLWAVARRACLHALPPSRNVLLDDTPLHALPSSGAGRARLFPDDVAGPARPCRAAMRRRSQPAHWRPLFLENVTHHCRMSSSLKGLPPITVGTKKTQLGTRCSLSWWCLGLRAAISASRYLSMRARRADWTFMCSPLAKSRGARLRNVG